MMRSTVETAIRLGVPPPKKIELRTRSPVKWAMRSISDSNALAQTSSSTFETTCELKSQ